MRRGARGDKGAGTFDAFRIEATDQVWGDFKPNSRISYYSPQPGRLKYNGSKMGSAHIELARYTRARQAARLGEL